MYRSVESVVGYGLAHRSLDEIEAIGVDEVQTTVFFTPAVITLLGKPQLFAGLAGGFTPADFNFN